MPDVVVLSGVRTPIGAFQGAFAPLTAPQLGAIAIRAALEKAGVSPDQVDEVLMGCVLQGGLGQAPARQAAKGAGVPDSVPCTTVNKVCGSGMKTVMMAAQAIKAGDAQVVVAGGMESMTNAPYAMPAARAGFRLGHAQALDLMIHDGLWDPYNDKHMGMCGDACASTENFSREELDAYAAESYQRALRAQEEGRLGEEIVPVPVPQRKGDPLMVTEDEEPKRGNPAKLPELRPAFNKDGVTTAGNASSLNDGAAAMVVASAEWASAQGLSPIGQVKAYVQYAHAPEWFTTAPAHAIERLLEKAGLTLDQIDLFEINEAFSVVPLYAARKLGIPQAKLNVNGGAVSLGHPIGMSGTRLLMTALHELRRRRGKYAIATPCIGGGEATAVLLTA
ncbi:MAG: thiolase family protein [Fimbriimonadaceae bacterium]|nr:thiolase family protein [Fimbriimonadaceae bacterium]QYK57095.1 MAG: thiolase family protein [Fimbriimonadaceae bacterium]